MFNILKTAIYFRLFDRSREDDSVSLNTLATPCLMLPGAVVLVAMYRYGDLWLSVVLVEMYHYGDLWLSCNFMEAAMFCHLHVYHITQT